MNLQLNIRIEEEGKSQKIIPEFLSINVYSQPFLLMHLHKILSINYHIVCTQNLLIYQIIQQHEIHFQQYTECRSIRSHIALSIP